VLGEETFRRHFMSHGDRQHDYDLEISDDLQGFKPKIPF
jgi:hypothetical protein